MSGAVRLCGEAALRSGAGKVTVVTHPEHHAMVNSTCPELMIRGSDDGTISRTLCDSVDVVVLGTGLGRSDWSEAVFDACRSTSAHLVVDADGLNILAERETDIARQADRTILTPHPAEAGRLLGCSAREVQADRFTAAVEIARKYHCVAIIKGCGTVIADQQGHYAVCPLGNPGMASAGTGDALSGVVGALLAQGLNSWDAALCGVVAHAAAGDLAALEIGERGMLASDLIMRLPRVLNARVVDSIE